MELSTGDVDFVSKRNGSRPLRKPLQIIPFKPRHVLIIKPTAGPHEIKIAEYAAENGFAYTACLCGTPIGAAGWCLKDGDAAELWAMFTPLFKGMPLTLYKTVVEKFAEARAKSPPLRRLYCMIDFNDEVAVRFVKRLGGKMTLHVYEFEV